MCRLSRVVNVFRLFLLDMLLGNADRFPCEALGWRGNPHNILYSDRGPLQVTHATMQLLMKCAHCSDLAVFWGLLGCTEALVVTLDNQGLSAQSFWLGDACESFFARSRFERPSFRHGERVKLWTCRGYSLPPRLCYGKHCHTYYTL